MKSWNEISEKHKERALAPVNLKELLKKVEFDVDAFEEEQFENFLELKNFIENFVIKNDCSSLEMKNDEEGHLHIIVSFKDFNGEKRYIGRILNKYMAENSNLDLDEQIKYVFNNILQHQIDELKEKK